jgi:hypothetical protein
MDRDRRTRTGARAPGVERRSRSNGGAPARTVPPAQNGEPTREAGSTKDKGKLVDARVALHGKALSDRPALKPYRGKPAVRNFREGNGNVGIMRSPLRAIALPDQSTRLCPLLSPTNTFRDGLRFCEKHYAKVTDFLADCRS